MFLPNDFGQGDQSTRDLSTAGYILLFTSVCAGTAPLTPPLVSVKGTNTVTGIDTVRGEDTMEIRHKGGDIKPIS